MAWEVRATCVLTCHPLVPKAVPSLRFSREIEPVILLHDNLLSCNLPRFDAVHARLSLAGFENQFWEPSRELAT